MTTKAFIKYAIAAVALCATSCREVPVENEGDPTTPQGEITAPYTIEVDKATIEANGVDEATFRVLDANGVDVTASDQAKYVYIKEVSTGNTLPRGVYSVTALKNGNTDYYATFKGEATSNQVTVAAVNRGQYEKYQHKICIYDITGAWCQYCPSMVVSLEALKKGWADNMIILGVHKEDRYSVGTLAEGMCNQFGVGSYPTCIYDLKDVSGSRSVAEITDIMNRLMIESPSTCGVKIISSELKNGTLTIEAAVKSDKGGEYDLGCAVLYDNAPAQQGDYVGEDGMYHDIVVAACPNFFQMRSDSKVTLAADEEYTQTFVFEGVTFTQVENMRVVAYALTNKGGNVYTDNATVCALGSSIDYVLNE